MEGRKEWHIEVGAPSKKASNSFIISFEISFTVNKMLSLMITMELDMVTYEG